jgi:hypothetical protein
VVPFPSTSISASASSEFCCLSPVSFFFSLRHKHQFQSAVVSVISTPNTVTFPLPVLPPLSSTSSTSQNHLGHPHVGRQANIYCSSTPILRSLQDGLQPIVASCEASVSHAQSATGPTKPIIRQSVRSTRCACEIRVHPPPLIDGALTTTVWKRCGRSDYRACVAETRGTCCMVAGKGFRRLSRDTWRRERLPPDLRIGLCGTRRGEEHGVRDSSHGDWDKKGLEAGGLVWRLIWKGHACGGRG